LVNINSNISAKNKPVSKVIVMCCVMIALLICFSANIFAKSNKKDTNSNNSSQETVLESSVESDSENSSLQSNNKSNKNNFNEDSTDYFNAPAQNQNGGTTRSRQPSTAWMFIRMILVLILVCVLIYVVFWLLKHKTNITTTSNEYLRRAAFINIGTNKTIEVITLIDKAYLIGVTEDNITLLGEIDDKELIQAMNITADKKQNVKNPVNFNEVLDLFTKKDKRNTNVFEASANSIDEMINQDSNQNANSESVSSTENNES